MAIDEKLRRYVKVFPATELLPYGEPVSPDEMQVGRVYFELYFLDADLLLPRLEPMIFLGVDLDGESKNERYFQDFNSYRGGVRYEKQPHEEESARFEVYGLDGGNHIFDYELALRVLMRCALDRRDKADVDQRIRRSADESSASESQP